MPGFGGRSVVAISKIWWCCLSLKSSARDARALKAIRFCLARPPFQCVAVVDIDGGRSLYRCELLPATGGRELVESSVSGITDLW